MNLRNFFNNVSKKNRIYYAEEIGRMKPEKFKELEAEINYQINNLGIPREADLRNSMDVYQERTSDLFGNKINNYYSLATDELSAPTPTLKGNVDYNVKVNKNGLTFGEELGDKLFPNMSKMLPIGGANLRNSRYDMESAKNDKDVILVNRRTDLGNTNLTEWMDKVGIPKDARGVIYKDTSLASNKLANSKAIADYIANNEDALRKRSIDTAVVEFLWNEDPDAFIGIQHATLHNPYIDEEGYFNATLNDYYDFKRRRGLNPINIINNWGVSMQDKKKLENYFNTYYIRKRLR